MARNLYAKFAKKWRQEKRIADVYGDPGYRRPNFNEWYSMHKEQLAKKKEAPPAYVQEQLEADPWLEENPAIKSQSDKTEERGVATINIAGSEDD
jgi:hypothetical protein